MRVDEFDRLYEVEMNEIDEVYEVDYEIDEFYEVKPTVRGIFEKIEC